MCNIKSEYVIFAFITSLSFFIFSKAFLLFLFCVWRINAYYCQLKQVKNECLIAWCSWMNSILLFTFVQKKYLSTKYINKKKKRKKPHDTTCTPNKYNTPALFVNCFGIYLCAAQDVFRIMMYITLVVWARGNRDSCLTTLNLRRWADGIPGVDPPFFFFVLNLQNNRFLFNKPLWLSLACSDTGLFLTSEHHVFLTWPNNLEWLVCF